MFTHNLAYKLMMVTGVGVSLLNLNPLIKLDGYFILSELIGDSDFHERTSAYLSGWVRKNIFRMPAELEYVRRWQRPLFLLYAFLSGIYGYVLLSFLMVFSYNVLHSYSPAWAFVPACLAGYWVFRKRIHSLGRFSQLLYLDKKERLWGWLTPRWFVGLGAVVLVLLFIPVWPDFEDASFILEPIRQASVHTGVKGRVVGVFVDEGQKVTLGQPLIQLEDVDLQSRVEKAHADSREATSRATESQIRYGEYGAAELERLRRVQEENLLNQKATRLQISSPISGVVATPHVQDLKGANLDEGAPVMDVVDYSTLVARVYLPEFSMHAVRVGSPVRLKVASRMVPISGVLGSISADWVLLDPALGQKEQLAGIEPPRFFAAEVRLPSMEKLLPGMTGLAKILIGHRSLAGLTWRFGRDLVARRVW
jgi:putative peptide zinc metalloprotease protein